MESSEPVREIRRLGFMPRIGPIAMAERAVDARADADRKAADQVIALDVLLRNLSRRAA